MLNKLIQKVRHLEPWEKTLYIMFVVQILSTTGFSTIFPFLPLYVGALGSTSGWSVELAVGLVYGVSNVSMMFASPIWGALADRYGRKIMVQRATFGAAILIFAMAYARSAEDLVVIRATQGVFTGVVSAVSALVASQAPRHRMGYAMGIVQVGLWAGVALGPVLGGTIADAYGAGIDNPYGYQVAIMVTSALLLFAGVLVQFGVHEVFVPPKKDTSNKKSLWKDWGTIITTPGVGVTYSLRFLNNLARMAIFPILPLLLAELLPDSAGFNTFTGLVFGVTAAASTATAVYLGKLGDKIGHRKVVIWSALAAGVLYIMQSGVTNEWQLFFLQALTGAASGGVLPALSALLARYTKPGEEGSVYGIDNAIGAGGRAMSPIVGPGVALLFSLRAAFIATGAIFVLISIVAFSFLPKSKTLAEREMEAALDG